MVSNTTQSKVTIEDEYARNHLCKATKRNKNKLIGKEPSVGNEQLKFESQVGSRVISSKRIESSRVFFVTTHFDSIRVILFSKLTFWACNLGSPNL